MDNEMVMELQRLEKQIHEVDDKVKQVLTILVGNALDKNDNGFIGMVTALEKRVIALEKWKDRIFWLLVGMALPAGVGIWELVSKMIK